MENKLIFDIFMSVFGCMVALSGVPQIIRIFKRRSSNDISMITYTSYLFGNLGWLFYGILIESWPLILSSLIALMISLIVISFCIVYRQFSMMDEMVDKVKEHVEEKWEEEWSDEIVEKIA